MPEESISLAYVAISSIDRQGFSKNIKNRSLIKRTAKMGYETICFQEPLKLETFVYLEIHFFSWQH